MKQEIKEIKGLHVWIKPGHVLTLPDGTQIKNKDNKTVNLIINNNTQNKESKNGQSNEK